MKWTKNKGIMVIFVVLLLVASFIWGGNHPKEKAVEKPVATQEERKEAPTEEEVSSGEKGSSDTGKTAEEKADEPKEQKVAEEQKPDEETPAESSEKDKKEAEQEQKKDEKVEEKKKDDQKKPEKKQEKQPSKMEINPKTGKDKYMTEPVPEGRPLPVEWQDVTIDEDAQYHCTLSVSCKTILDNIDLLDKNKLEVVPEDGVIYAEKEVVFYDGESVFNVLQREMKKNKIHLEFEMTPVYNSNYIEGINNLYEFDCGELSGWMYKVNGWFPNYGSSRYRLRDGDRIEWVYTCDLGRDVGDNYLGNGGSGGE
ncbi:MAG: DUF4430 domain-containing protein [Filifactor alocis]|nr:DUF4430 domain-containing protein [Filifactor alocis]